jgi:hypothetical protein
MSVTGELRRRRTSGRSLRMPNDILIESGESRFDASGDATAASWRQRLGCFGEGDGSVQGKCTIERRSPASQSALVIGLTARRLSPSTLAIEIHDTHRRPQRAEVCQTCARKSLVKDCLGAPPTRATGGNGNLDKCRHCD